ncbi:MAG: hypothetical protein MJB12_02855 [Firmicutes bacterium]|nr:hypothetical protein [Bacillota bacterium]
MKKLRTTTSYSTPLPHIDVILRPFSIKLDYVKGAKNIDDPRSDKRIYNVLNETGKLSSTGIYTPPAPAGVFSVGEEIYGNDLMYRRPEIRGRKSEYNEAGKQSNQRQDVVYGGTFSTLISQPSTTFLPWNISYWNNFLHLKFMCPAPAALLH